MNCPRLDDAFDSDLLLDAIARGEALDLAERPPPSSGTGMLIDLLDPALDDDA